MRSKKIPGKALLLSSAIAIFFSATAYAGNSARTINGTGKDACPSDSLCLYADINFNGQNKRTKILVIPSGTKAGDFTEYGFDYSDDGVSSVYNNTGHETGLIAGMRLAGEVLHLTAGQSIADLTKEPLGDGTWNDAAKSAISAAVLESSMQLTLRGPASAISGDKIAYTIDVSNSGPENVDDARVDIAIPEHLHDVKVSCSADEGADCGTLSANKTRQNLVLPKNGRAVINVEGTTAAQFVGSLAANAIISSEKTVNTATNNSDSFKTEVKQAPVVNLQATDTLRANWSEWPGHVYSYRISLKANKEDVRNWDISFDGLPTGVKIKEPNSLWVRVIQDGSTDGKIILGTPGDDKYLVKAGETLDIDLQLYYPNQNTAYEKLQNLTAHQQQ